MGDMSINGVKDFSKNITDFCKNTRKEINLKIYQNNIIGKLKRRISKSSISIENSSSESSVYQTCSSSSFKSNASIVSEFEEDSISEFSDYKSIRDERSFYEENQLEESTLSLHREIESQLDGAGVGEDARIIRDAVEVSNGISSIILGANKKNEASYVDENITYEQMLDESKFLEGIKKFESRSNLYNISRVIKKNCSNMVYKLNKCKNTIFSNVKMYVKYVNSLWNKELKFKEKENIYKKFSKFVEFIHEEPEEFIFSKNIVLMPIYYSGSDSISGFTRKYINHKNDNPKEMVDVAYKEINSYISSVFGDCIAEKIEENFLAFNNDINFNAYREFIPKEFAEVARSSLEISDRKPFEILSYMNTERKNEKILLRTKNEKGDILLSVNKDLKIDKLLWPKNRKITFYKNGVNNDFDNKKLVNKIEEMQSSANNMKVDLVNKILNEMHMLSEIFGGPGYIYQDIYDFFGNDIVTAMERISIGRSDPIPSYYYHNGYSNDKKHRIEVLEELSDIAKISKVIPQGMALLEEVILYCDEERKNGRSILLNKDKNNNIILLSVEEYFGDAKIMWGYEDVRHGTEIEEWRQAIEKMRKAANDFIEENKILFTEKKYI